MAATDSSDPLAETRAQLTAEAHGRTGKVPPALVAEHIICVTAGGDWHLRQAALEALLRRVKAARESCDAWKVESRPRGRSPLGAYRVSVGHKRSYAVQLFAADALDASCDCPDFARGSLRLCKHAWWLLEAAFDAQGRAAPGALTRPALRWDPVRPLTGPGDWLERLTLKGDVPAPLRRFFQREGDGASVRRPLLASSPARAELARALRQWVDAGTAKAPRADVALIGMLRREDDRLQRRGDAPDAKAVTRGLKTLKRSLFAYQEDGLNRFLTEGRFLLADDMGLGKTAQAIASCHVLYATNRVKRGLLIVPAALKVQWQREWNLFTDVPLSIVDGPPTARRAQYRSLERGFLVVNYEQVLKDLPELVRLAPELVVLDEAQRIKNWAAKTSMYVKALTPRWRLVLTGTPLENRLDELASLMEWVDDLALEPKWRLAEWHTVRADGSRDVIGVKNLETLRARIAPSTLRRTRKEVLSQLPPRTDIQVPVSMTAEQAEAHGELDQPIARLVSTARRRPLTQPEFLRLMSLFTRQRVVCNGLAQRDFEQVWPLLEKGARPTEAALKGLFSPKLSELRELVANLVLTQGRKVVVFSAWKRMLRLAAWAVSDLLGDAGLRAVFFTGDESTKRRTQNIVDFHDDERTRLFFATDAGGVGLNLQRAATACVHLDLPWNPAVLEQRSGRIYRLGQTSPVDVYSLVAAEGIESRIAGVISSKRALFGGLFDGTSDEVRFEQGGSMAAQLGRLATPEVAGEPGAAVEISDDELVAEDEGIAEAPAPEPLRPEAPGSASPVASFLEGITVQRLDDGRMVLEAKPEAAATFAAMLEGMAALLRQLPAAGLGGSPPKPPRSSKQVRA
jgi:hypothetical protein